MQTKTASFTMEKEILSFKEACQFLGYSPATVYQMTSKKTIPFSQRNSKGKLFFEKAKLQDWLLSKSYNGLQEEQIENLLTPKTLTDGNI